MKWFARIVHAWLVASLLLAAAATTDAAPPEAPKEPVKAKVGKPSLIDLKVVDKGAFGYALGFDKADCPFVRLYADDATTASFMAIPEKAGTYYVTFWTVGEKGYSQLVLVVEEDKPKPPPAPVPVPVPPAPAPTDPFSVSVAQAYAQEADPAKVQYVAVLAALYRNASVGTVNDESVKTNADLFADLSEASNQLAKSNSLPKAAIPLVRKAVATRLNASIGARPNDPISRPAAAAELAAAASALEALK
jgi:hypothetical protein